MPMRINDLYISMIITKASVMKMAFVSLSYINMANYSLPPRSKSETVIKFKRTKYE